uniref:RRM domain-containing protein n=2 Tax=Bursaphelenchus xylophilus TaxID=6326 RepID=A0A1I7RYA8_BURXY
MLHEKPVFVALAISQKNVINNTLGRSLADRRTVSPASAASTSSSGDSAIGTTSPSTTASISPGSNEQVQLQIAYSIQNEDGKESHIIEVTATNIEEDLQKITNDLGPHAILVCCTEDIRQVLHPIAAIQATKNYNVGEVMDSTLRQRLPAVFNQFVNLETLTDVDELGLKNVTERCKIIHKIIQEKGLDLLNLVENINEGYTPFVNFDRRVDSSLIVRTRGLPWQASDQDIALFFAGLNIAPGGIALCLGNEGRRNGESLVCFECNSHRELAIKRHRKFLHNRYIEVYRSTAEEFLEVAVGSDSETLKFVCRDAAMIIRMRGLPFDCTEHDIRAFFSSDGQSGIMEEGVMFVNRPDGRPTGDAFVLFGDDESGRRALAKHKNRIGSRYIELFRTTQAEVQQIISRIQQKNITPASISPMNTNPRLFTTKRDCLRMRGLPYEAKPEQIADFLGIHAKNINDKGIHMILNNQGTPSGEAFIQMKSDSAASMAAIAMHNKNMELGKKKRYIEVFQCSVEELQGVLNPPAQFGHVNLPFGIPPNTFVTLPGLLSNQLQLAPQFTMANNYQRICAMMNQNVMPQGQMTFHAPPAAVNLNFAPNQLNILGQGFGALPGQLPCPFPNDQLYTATTHFQQQHMGFFDPNQPQGFPPSLHMPHIDVATAAALIHQQNLMNQNNLKASEGFLPLDVKAVENGRSHFQHC